MNECIMKNDWKIAENALNIFYPNVVSKNPANQFSWNSLGMKS